MRIRTLLLASAVGAAAVASPAIARDNVAFAVSVGPPPPRVEYVPPPRPGYVWAPGYWNWNGHHHVWVKGHYMRGHRHAQWVPDHWEQHGDRWYHERGHWSH